MDSLLPIDLATLIQTMGYLGIFLIVFADSGVLLGLVLPGDSLLFTAGLLASQGHLNLWLLMLVAALGAILGDSAGYAFGKRMGPHLFMRKDSWFFTTRHLDRARHFYARHGGKTIFLARFLHFVRTLAPMIAGAADMHYGTFLFYNVFGGLFWAISVSALGYWLGNTVPNIDHYILPILGVIGLLALSPTIVRLLHSVVKQRHIREELLAFNVVPLNDRHAIIAESLWGRGSEKAAEVTSASDASSQETRGMVLSLEHSVARNGTHALLSPNLYTYEGIRS